MSYPIPKDALDDRLAIVGILGISGGVDNFGDRVDKRRPDVTLQRRTRPIRKSNGGSVGRLVSNQFSPNPQFGGRLMPAAVPRLFFNCQQCGAQFARMACQIKRERDKPRYCSASCRCESQKRGEQKQCAECEKIFYSISHDRTKFCSRECYDKNIKRDAHSYPKMGGRHAHRVVMEKKLGRSLGPKDIVHHDDEDRLNFDVANLVLTDRKEHARIHFSGVKQSPEHIRKRVVATGKAMRKRGLWK